MTACIGCLAVLLTMMDAWAAEMQPERAPTATNPKPGDLLKKPDGLELRFGYFPSFDKLRLLVLRTPDAFTGWEARLSKPPSKEVLRQWDGPLPFPKAGLTLDAPVLDEGTYMLSFGTLLLDHEWRDQGEFREKDFHERLYLDDDASLLLAQSTGFQSGCIGVVHNLLRGEAQIRSALGVALVHEMKLDVNTQSVVQNAAGHLCELGYGLPDCRVWRFWDEPQPVQVQGVPVKTLTLARAGKAMIILSSFGPAGEVTFKVNPQMLGLSQDVVAANAETGEPLAQMRPGSFRLILPRHDFRLIRLTPPRTGK